MNVIEFTGTHRLTLVEDKTLSIEMEKLDYILPETLPDGFYETIRDDFTMEFFRIRKGMRRELTEPQLRVQIAGAAARDPKTRKVDKSKLTMSSRLDAVVRRALDDDLGYLEGSVNGIRNLITILPDGSKPKAWSDKFVAGRYRGSFKGDAIEGKEHHVQTTSGGYLRALKAFGETWLSDRLIALDAKFVGYANGGASLYNAVCVFGNLRGDSIVNRCVAIFPDGNRSVSKEVRGMKSRITAGIRAKERQRLAELAAERDREREEMERPMREAEHAAAERDRLQRIEDAKERRSRTIVPRGDMDSLGGVNF